MQSSTFPEPTSKLTGQSWATLCVFALPVLALTSSFGMSAVQLLILLASIFYARAGLLAWYGRHFHAMRGIVLAFAGFFLISVVRGVAAGRGWSSIDGPSRLLFALTCLGFIGWCKPNIRHFWLGLCLGTIGACLLALVQRFFLGIERVDGYTHHPISFGNVALAMGCMALCGMNGMSGLQNSRSLVVRYLPILAFFCGLIGSVLSGSRGGWLALPLLIPLVYLVACAQSSKVQQKLLISCALLGCLLVLAYAIPATGVALRIGEAFSDIQRYSQHQDANTSVGIRLELWKASVMMFLDHPWLGVGRDQFQSSLQALAQQQRIPVTEALKFSSSHNDALHFLATGGLLDFSFLLLLYGAPLHFFWKTWQQQPLARPPALAGMCLVVCYIGFGLTDVMFWLMMTKVFYVMMVGVLAGLCCAASRKPQG